MGAMIGQMDRALPCAAVHGRGEETMDATAMLEGVLRRGGEAATARRLAALFAEDGVYHDLFYGAFAGRARRSPG